MSGVRRAAVILASIGAIAAIAALRTRKVLHFSVSEAHAFG